MAFEFPNFLKIVFLIQWIRMQSVVLSVLLVLTNVKTTGILHITWKEVWLQNEKQCFKMPLELFLMGMSTIL